jgi:uncharacterized protein (TIGR02453 family)
VHAPGFYVHIASDGCFLGVGCWHPDADSLARVRDWLAADPERWFSVRDDRSFAGQWTLSGDSLMRPPRGYAADHAAIEDLKRKDFVGIAPLSADEVVGQHLVGLVGARFAAASPFIRFLCAALDLRY